VRSRTAAIVSGVLIALTCGMFGLEAALRTFLLPPSELGFPVSGFDRALFGVDFFCERWKWILVPLTLLIVVVLFTVAVFTDDSKAGETARPTTTPTGQPPALWNPKAAAYWSLLFSPAFGAFLHARNADAMGRVDEAKANRVWFYVWFAYIAVTLTPIHLPHGIAGGLLLVWYFSLGKNQVAYVKETWRDGYERRPWKTPLLTAFCCLIGATVLFAGAEALANSLR